VENHTGGNCSSRVNNLRKGGSYFERGGAEGLQEEKKKKTPAIAQAKGMRDATSELSSESWAEPTPVYKKKE